MWTCFILCNAVNSIPKDVNFSLFSYLSTHSFTWIAIYHHHWIQFQTMRRQDANKVCAQYRMLQKEQCVWNQNYSVSIAALYFKPWESPFETTKYMERWTWYTLTHRGHIHESCLLHGLIILGLIRLQIQIQQRAKAWPLPLEISLSESFTFSWSDLPSWLFFMESVWFTGITILKLRMPSSSSPSLPFPTSLRISSHLFSP